MSSNIPDPRYCRAGFIKSLEDQRQARETEQQQAISALPEPDRDQRLSDAFRDAFQPKRQQQAPVREHGQPATESPWDRVLRTLGPDDDAPRPPQVEPEPVAALAPVAPPVPPEETRARQEALSAEALFQQMESRLQATSEAVTVGPDVQLRRLFRELPGAQREALAAKVEAEDFGLSGYFSARNFGPDYVSVLVGHSLAKRYADAVRLQPDLSPDALLAQMLSQAN